MKTKNPLTSLLFLTMCHALLFSSCHKKADPAPDAKVDNTPKGTLMFHLHVYANEIGEIQNYSDIDTTDNGRAFVLDSLDPHGSLFYISHIQLVRSDGSLCSLSDTTLLKVLDEDTYQVKNVPVGNYKSIRFNIGLDSATGKKTPSSWDNALNNPTMWFGSTAQPEGYVYLNLQGKIDTSRNATGSPEKMQAFKYLIGTLPNYRQVSLPEETFSVAPNQTALIHLYANFGQLFNGIDLSNPENLHVETRADNAKAVAKKIADNITSMFHYE